MENKMCDTASRQKPEATRRKLTAKERLAIPVQEMREQHPQERVQNVREVPCGYTPEQAMTEAERCLCCKNPSCIAGCPVGVDIPAFVALMAEGKFHEAAMKIREANLLPAICGRVCPQEDQCQVACTVTKSLKDLRKSVQIGKLERFVADWEMEHGPPVEPVKVRWTGKKVAVIGSGPAGLTLAGDLVIKGHEVTIFEALHRPGGVLVYGIPEFRLPKAIVDREIDSLTKMGVNLICNAVIGRSKTIRELFDEGYDAVFIGVGAGLPVFKKIPGENLLGVYSANEFLTRANLMDAYNFPHGSDTPIMRPKNCVVFGGGNVAMDAARTARRLGAENVTILYRRSETEMPARLEEVHHAKEEEIAFRLLQDATRIIGNGKGWVTHVEVQEMELGEPDSSGRRRPIPIEGSEFLIPADCAVVAIGNRSNPLLTTATPEVKVNERGNIVVDKETMRTTMKGVWAGGDIVLGAATVILAMGQARLAAKSIHDYLTTGAWQERCGET
jgi:glutamate synthase (NADPH/NADH) small chain